MGVDRVLMLKLLGDTSSIDKSLKGTQRRMAELSKWGKAFTLGLAIDAIEGVADALGNAWEGFREGEKAIGQLQTTWGNLGKDGDELAGVIDRIGESTLRLGTDDTEAVLAFNEALKTVGGDGEAAMDRLRIAQDLVANGAAPNLQSALKLITQAGKGSARVVDRFGLTSDTAAGRIKELADKVKGAAKRAADLDPLGVLFNQMNEDLENIVGHLASGDLDKALSSLGDIGDHVAEAWGKVGPGVTETFDKLSGGAFSDVMTKLRELGEKVGPKVAGVLGAMGAAWVALQVHLANALTFIQPVIDILGRSMEGGLAFVLDSVTIALSVVSALLRGDFGAAFAAVKDGVGQLATDLDTFFLGLPGKIAGWAVDIVNEASLLGIGIFEGIKSWVGKLPESIGKIIGQLAVGIATVWNSLGRFGAGGFTFAEAFQVEIAGQKFGWPKIAIEWGAGDLIPNIDVPKMAKGGIVNSPTLAMIGEAGREAVVPLDRMGGMGDTYNINVNVAPGGDLVATGKAIVDAIRQYERRSGRVWRSA